MAAAPELFAAQNERNVGQTKGAKELQQRLKLSLEAASMLAGSMSEPAIAGALAGSAAGNKVSIKQETPIWSSTNSKSSLENAFSHCEKHSKEIPELANSKQYVEAAHSFAANPPAGAVFKSRGADTLIYDKNTNTFW
ncbi:hypothetical protein [Noviherbaspirillum humi]|uniref:hypothetical protein n=1 Tax=Noviherbaspirillum humi TaxID=1688639 RepID=UPI00116019F6|nr:hypothetical protein [Noviherbaspirillum humi]